MSRNGFYLVTRKSGSLYPKAICYRCAMFSTNGKGWRKKIKFIPGKCDLCSSEYVEVARPKFFRYPNFMMRINTTKKKETLWGVEE